MGWALGLAVAALTVAPVGAWAREFATNADAGNNSMSAVFGAAIGERIMAVSSAVDCTLEVDEAKLVCSATCCIPLESIQVDSEPTKTEHFQQWATNKKGSPAECSFDLVLDPIDLKGPVAAKVPVEFETTGTSPSLRQGS
ncbi:MAG: hypothetical protein P8R42_20825 [Candidatus Binatia bacterium]|nr:hypothetical protein [Candidatus Binatia bacterium]